MRLFAPFLLFLVFFALAFLAFAARFLAEDFFFAAERLGSA